MDVFDINNESSLNAWLSDKPAKWAQAIALRAALRSLPFIGVSSDPWLKDFALLPFGAVFTSWVQLTESSIDIFVGSRANARFGGESFNFSRYKESRLASMAADVSYHSADAQTQSMHAISDCIKAVGKADRVFRDFAESRKNWKDEAEAAHKLMFSVQDDCQLLLDPMRSNTAGTLAIKRLWSRVQIASTISIYVSSWDRNWMVLSKRLLAIDPNYSVWTDWYERRIRGERAAFEIPGDKGRIEDKKILRRLAEATDDDFWGKGHEHVNATLKGWLDEARARVAPPPITAEASGTFEISGSAIGELGPLPPPAQNRNALSFRADEYGRITIDTTALADQLRIDAGAQDRHSEAIAEAKMVFDRCQRSNAGARLTRLFDNYLDAAGESVEVVKPSLLVQRGERLRQELEAYTNPDTFLDPLADDLLLDMKGWQSAHNMMVGLDPVLNAMDTAILGPDRQPSLMPPDEIRQKSEAADEAGILAENVSEVLIEAADLAPADPDPNNRRTILSNEMMRNLIIEAFSVAMNNPKKAVVGIVLTGVAVSAMPAGATLLGAGGGAMAAAGFLVREREWIEKQMGNTPAWRDLFLHVSKLIEEKTHFKPKSSDKSE